MPADTFDTRKYFMGSLALILLLFCGIVFAVGGILLSKALAKTSTNPQKGETYECGIPTSGTSFIQFNVGYYLFALVFLVFDVELVFMYPWAVVVKDIGMLAFSFYSGFALYSIIDFLIYLLICSYFCLLLTKKLFNFVFFESAFLS